ncbi:MAG TPA: methylmalonyl-CoA mutase subunit beta [Flavobacteriaceae bacterium]|nr:methylmalonyl-CoA mutase subunit beta [Flavobacteriaceae bacterium]
MSNFITKEFESSSAAEWKQKIQADLKGADYNETLLTHTNEGITIKPFYHADNFEKLSIPVKGDDFKICEEIVVTSAKQANEKAVNVVERGAEALKFIVEENFDTQTLFNNLLNKNVAFHFEFKTISEKFITELAEVLKNETVYFNIDVIGKLAETGNWYNNLENDFELVENLLKNSNAKVVLGVNANVYQNAGANTVQQVAYAIAHANEYFTRFGADVASKIQFNFATGSNYFFEISKIRAFRYLLNLILSEYNTSVNAQVYAEPTKRNKTIYDYNVNMLRTTTESMSAILGGANTVANMAYDSLFHNANEFGSRIARNQLLILKEESYFNNAQRIASESYYIEAITKQIAEKALAIFKEIEKSGGFLHQLKEGTVQRKITENANKEQEQFNNGELVLLGTNKYPNNEDKMKHDLEKSPFLSKNPQKTLITPILPKRLAETLEQKRLEDEA